MTFWSLSGSGPASARINRGTQAWPSARRCAGALHATWPKCVRYPARRRLPSEKRRGATAGGRTRWADGLSAWRGRCSSGTGSGRARRADAEGSREFESVKAYRAFVAGVVARRNARGSTSPDPAIHGS